MLPRTSRVRAAPRNGAAGARVSDCCRLGRPDGHYCCISGETRSPPGPFRPPSGTTSGPRQVRFPEEPRVGTAALLQAEAPWSREDESEVVIHHTADTRPSTLVREPRDRKLLGTPPQTICRSLCFPDLNGKRLRVHVHTVARCRRHDFRALEGESVWL